MTRALLPSILLGIWFVADLPAVTGEAFVNFRNNTSGQLRVEIFHSNNKLQKGKYIEPGDLVRFRFSSSEEKCRNKSRTYRIYQAPGGSKQGAPITTGDFTFVGKFKSVGSNSACYLLLERLSTNVNNRDFDPDWDESDVGETRTTISISER